MSGIKPDGGFRTSVEKEVGKKIEEVFTRCTDSVEVKLENFPKYVKRQKFTRLCSLYEIFKKIMPIKGSIIDCGVYHGFSLMSWANFSAVLEPNNFTRRIYGFDTFKGFPNVAKKDNNHTMRTEVGQLGSDSFNELTELIKIYDSNRFLGHVNKVNLIKGDVNKTIPKFINNNKHLVVSLLYLDMDLYEPTKVAIENFYPRMPKGSILAFDELDNPIWPGETSALLETIGIKRLKIERLEFDPYIGFAIID